MPVGPKSRNRHRKMEIATKRANASTKHRVDGFGLEFFIDSAFNLSIDLFS